MEPNSDTNQPQPTISPTINPTPPISPVVPIPKPKSRIGLLIGGILILGLGFTIGLLFNKNLSPTSQASPTPTPSLTPTPQAKPDPAQRDTTNWKTYTNTKYNYSIKYPPNLTTQVQAAGTGTKEASLDTDHYYIYDQSSKNSYSERYLEIQPLGQAVNYGAAWQKTDIKIGDINAAKYTNPDPGTFIIYSVAVPNTSGELEIMIAKDQEKSILANQILSTFTFLEQNVAQ